MELEKMCRAWEDDVDAMVLAKYHDEAAQWWARHPYADPEELIRPEGAGVLKDQPRTPRTVTLEVPPVPGVEPQTPNGTASASDGRPEDWLEGTAPSQHKIGKLSHSNTILDWYSERRRHSEGR